MSTAEFFLIATLLILGGMVVFMTPLGAGFDEDQHFNRVWQMANLQIIPRELPWRQSKFPKIYFELSYRKQPLVDSVGFDYWEKYGSLKLYDHGFYFGSLDTRSRYNPLLLLPHALVLRYSAFKFELPALSVYYATRFAGLITYIFLVCLAVRLIPIGKLALICLAIAPAAIYQASTISADTLTNGIGLLFIGGTLAVANKQEIKFREWGALILLIAALFLTKPNIYPLVLLPFLMISPSRFANRTSYFLLILCSMIVFGIEVLGWNALSPNPGFAASGSVNAVEQIKYILSNPLAYPRILLNDLILQGPNYLRQWVGVYGYDYGRVPVATYYFFALGIFLTLFIKNPQKPDFKTRMILLLVFLLCYIATSLSLYVTYTAVGTGFVYGVQGRYFIPIIPLLLLALQDLPAINNKLQAGFFSAGFFSLAAAVTFVGGLVLTYHVTCGPSYYSTGLCYQPFYKNYSPLLRSTAPVSNGVVLVQEIKPVCDGLTLVQVRINSSGTGGTGTTEFVVVDKSQNIKRIEKIFQNNNLPDDAWVTLDFEPDWNSAGKSYELTIRGLDGQANEGPLVAYSQRPEYPAGSLYLDGVMQEDDVIFQYGCITGLTKALQNMQP